MDRQLFGGLDRTQIVDWFADHVHHAAKRPFAYRDRDWPAQVDGLHATHHAFGRFHGDAAHTAFPKVLLHLKDDLYGRRNVEAFAGYLKRLVDRRQVRFAELNVDRGPRDLNYFSGILSSHNSFLRGRRLYCAAAPLTISMISFVILACRTRFICSVRLS